MKKEEHIYLKIINVIGFDANINFKFKTYGNQLAAGRMDFHYMFIGPGRIILQTQNIKEFFKKIKIV